MINLPFVKKELLLVGVVAALLTLPACAVNNKLSKLDDREIIVKSKSNVIQDLHAMAQDDVPVAMGKMAQEYYDGINVKRNDEKAFYWATEGEKLNDPLATMILARMYYYGEMTQPLPNKAIELLNKIKDKRLDARYVLGKMYEEQAVNNPEYVQLGLDEIKQSAELGLAQAQLDMAETLRSGATNGELSNDAKEEALRQSADYLAMAVAQGNVVAMRNLGLYYHEGIGLAKNNGKAKQYLGEAAQQGDAMAKEILNKI